MKVRLLLPIILTATLSAGTTARADVVMDWNEIGAARVLAARQSPPDGARTMAMMHVAMFDAINAVLGGRGGPYLPRQGVARPCLP